MTALWYIIVSSSVYCKCKYATAMHNIQRKDICSINVSQDLKPNPFEKNQRDSSHLE